MLFSNIQKVGKREDLRKLTSTELSRALYGFEIRDCLVYREGERDFWNISGFIAYMYKRCIWDSDIKEILLKFGKRYGNEDFKAILSED